MKKVGIVGAMDVEVAPILGLLRDARTDVRARMTFTSGELDGVPVVVAHSGVGKVNAGICGYVLTGELGCDAVVFVNGKTTTSMRPISAMPRVRFPSWGPRASRRTLTCARLRSRRRGRSSARPRPMRACTRGR